MTFMMRRTKRHRTCWFPKFFSRWSALADDDQGDALEQAPSLQKDGYATPPYGTYGKRTRLDFANVLEIHVGDEGCFWVPQNRITQRSEFFWEYCLRLPLDGEEVPVIELPTGDRFIFDMYLQVVYQDEVVLPLHVEEAKDPHWGMRVMLRVYLLAEKLRDVKSGNIILDSLIDFCFHHDLVFAAEDWRLIFNSEYKGTILRKLAVDFCVLATQPDLLESQLREMPVEMATDCIAKFAHLRHDTPENVAHDEASDTSATSLISLERCINYHQHNESCPSCPSLSRSGSESQLPTHRHSSPVGSAKSSESGARFQMWY